MKTICEALADGTVTQIVIVSERDDLAALPGPLNLSDPALGDPATVADKLKAGHAAKLAQRAAAEAARHPKQ